MNKFATFGGGCFWCLEPPFDKQKGVYKTTVGYMGGHLKNPTYEQVTTGKTGHAEVIQVEYDPEEVSYWDLLKIFWSKIDPTQVNGQFADRGTQYRTVIFYHDEEQRADAERSKQRLEDSGLFKKSIVTEVVAASDFYPAEDYHQDYYIKKSGHYAAYYEGSGRGAFCRVNVKAISALYGDEDEDDSE